MKTKKAFSLIEVVFVLVILGIVASISSQIIVQVYENYIIQKSIYKVNHQTEIVANQLVNRLTYKIAGTTISKNHQAFLDFYKHGTALPADTWLKIEDVLNGGQTYTSLEWIGYDNDSFDANATPYWSGVANYEVGASVNGFSTPASSLSNVSTIMSNLSKDSSNNPKVDLNTNNHPAAVIFLEKSNRYSGTNEYDPICMGLIPTDAASTTDCIFPVVRSGDNNLTFTTTPAHPTIVPKRITERYKLAWSAYAVAPELNTKGLHDLVLYSNYQPWNGENYIQDGTRHILMKNVSVFKFSENGGTLQFKICGVTQIGKDENISSCKEKVLIK